MFAFQVNQAKISGQNKYGINDQVLASSILPLVLAQFGNYLLPQAFPEGCPLHPSYNQMHGIVAGAGGAILKAFFDGDFLMNEYVPTSDGTGLVATGCKVRVTDEINKLTSNTCLFRNGAGVHFRSDARGAELGENIAIQVLTDLVFRYPYQTGFRFQRLDGTWVTITNSKETQPVTNDAQKSLWQKCTFICC
jgi:hypothetical protein